MELDVVNFNLIHNPEVCDDQAACRIWYDYHPAEFSKIFLEPIYKMQVADTHLIKAKLYGQSIHLDIRILV